MSRDEDAIVAHTCDLGVPVTTDPEDIAAFLRRRRSARGVRHLPVLAADRRSLRRGPGAGVSTW